MQTVTFKQIASARFRSNPNYELIAFACLSASEQEYFRHLQNDPSLYGVLRPRNGLALGWKSICQETACLYQSLEHPGPIPDFVQEQHGDQMSQALAELVLDSVLEVEAEGRFVTSAEAYPLLYGRQVQPVAAGRIPRLSVEALRYAQELGIKDPMRLTARLYFYNCVPVSPAWKRRWPDTEAIASFLGIRAGDAFRNQLEKDWMPVRLKPPNDEWAMWHSRAHKPRAKDVVTYKLYISPLGESIRDVLWTAADILKEGGAYSFKIGAKEASALLRPDKMVCYFLDFDAMQETAARLQTRLQGCPAQGVPFSAACDEQGLLSWGMDPIDTSSMTHWSERPSWRIWVTSRLAAALLAADAVPNATLQPWQFALERLSMEGVDVQTWTPVRTIWDEPLPAPSTEREEAL